MEEENKTNEEQQEETNISPIEEAKKVRDEIKKDLSEFREIKAQIDEEKVINILSGNSDAGKETEIEKKEETNNKDYAKEALEGKYNNEKKE